MTVDTNNLRYLPRRSSKNSDLWFANSEGGGERRGGEGMGGRVGEGRGGMTVIHIILMAPYIQTNNEELYLYNNDVTYYVIP